MTDTSNAGTINDLFRSLGSALNRGAYFLLSIMYQIFFNVASAQLFENETIKNFYGRIQLIIGVFMVFKLSISILQGIMNPDQFMDPKSGFGSFITRVITALFLLTVLVPISIPDVEEANSYEKYINNNGILFGTLYSLQNRILSNNTLGRLILGTTDGDVEDTSNDESDGLSESERQNKKLEKSANIFTSTILKGFLRINMKPEDSWEDDDSNNRENWYCGADLNDDAESAVETYNQLNVSPSILLNDNLVNADCDIEKGFLGVRFLGGKGGYVFLFDWLWSLFVGVIVLIIFVGFTVDIAIRAIKLAVLRLLAPIPAISYIDPKSAKDGMFASWVKALTSTYLDLFLRLAIVYFVIFLIQDMIVNGIIINTATGAVGVFSFIFIVIGLLLFAKMAPKFITDALGLKGAMSNIGLSGILGGAGALVGGAGLAGAGATMLSNVDAASRAAAEGKKAPPAWQSGADIAAQIKTGDPKAKGGLLNNINDNLMRRAGISRARKIYGVTASGVKEAKDNMYARQAEASSAEDLYNRFVDGHASEAELNAWARENGSTYNSEKGSITDPNGVVKTAQKALYDDMSNKQSLAAKAKSQYDKVNKFADSHRISPSFEEEHRRSVKESARDKFQALRHPISTAGNALQNQNGDHPGIEDRIFGTNRWSTSSADTHINANADNPNRDIDVPTAGGPPPRP